MPSALPAAIFRRRGRKSATSRRESAAACQRESTSRLDDSGDVAGRRELPASTSAEAQHTRRRRRGLKRKAASQDDVLSTGAPSANLGEDRFRQRTRQRGRKKKAAAQDDVGTEPVAEVAASAPPSEIQCSGVDEPEQSGVAVDPANPDNAEESSAPRMSADDLARVEVTGTGAGSAELRPWLTFADVRAGGPKGRLPAPVVAFMAKWKRFTQPTAIQSHCWPAACAGRDIVGLSKTGSGKTLAYVLPCLKRIMAFHTSNSESFGPYAMVLAPTRELATQIEKETKGLCRALGIGSVCLYGGAPKNEQIKMLNTINGLDVVVATPGRLHDFVEHVDKFTGRPILSLSMVSYAVLDEADCMLDLGFEPQIRKIFAQLAKDKQTLFFSATWPQKVDALACVFLKSPLYVRVGSCDALGATGNRDVQQHVVVVELDKKGEPSRQRKKEELWRILWKHDGDQCLIFCSMKKTAAVLAHQLKEDGFLARGLHGDMAQRDRDESMKSFKNGATKVLVATDVAARGLDVQGIAAVVNYDPAVQLSDHVHRVGRTSRAGNLGTAYTLIGAEDVRQAKFIAESMKAAGQDVPGAVAEVAGKRLDNAKARKVASQRAKKKAMKKQTDNR